MFLAVGIPGAGAVAILHLLTHGFFKACMFLSAGSVMHGMNDQVDMRRFGGLRKAMPVTFGCMGIGYLAIIGVPPFAGFFSKDLIIEAAFDQGGARGYLMGGIAVLAAGLTAFYMSRLMIMTFFGEKRWTDDVHPHESPKVMTVPMLLLAVGSVVSGFLLVHVFDLAHWLEPVLGAEEARARPVAAHRQRDHADRRSPPAWRSPTGCSRHARSPLTAPVAVTPFTVAARKNLYFDASTSRCSCAPGSTSPARWSSSTTAGIDGAVNGLAAAIGGGSARLRRVQTGFVRSYALSMFAGAALVVAALLAVRLGA